MAIKEIFSQDKAVSILQKVFASEKIPHAYIFSGAEGIGKFKTAYQWAKLLLCKNPVVEKDFADSCGSCQSCTLLEAGSHPDFNHIYKELKQYTKKGQGKAPPLELPIDVIREFLIAKIKQKPTLSNRKVFVISEAEKLTTESQNSLLKALEEPPKYCSIILLCTRLAKLLPTTKSRCQIIGFGPVAEEKIIEYLNEKGLEQNKSKYFARLSQGSLGIAGQWAELDLKEADIYESKKHIVNSLAVCEYSDSLNLAEWFVGKIKVTSDIWAKLDNSTSKKDIHRRTAKAFVQIVISALHDAIVLKVSPTKGLTNFDQKQKIENIAQHFTLEQLAEKISDCYKTLSWIDSAVNEKLIFEQMLLNLAIFGNMKN